MTVKVYEGGTCMCIDDTVLLHTFLYAPILFFFLPQVQFATAYVAFPLDKKVVLKKETNLFNLTHSKNINGG